MGLRNEGWYRCRGGSGSPGETVECVFCVGARRGGSWSVRQWPGPLSSLLSCPVCVPFSRMRVGTVRLSVSSLNVTLCYVLLYRI